MLTIINKFDFAFTHYQRELIEQQMEDMGVDTVVTAAYAKDVDCDFIFSFYDYNNQDGPCLFYIDIEDDVIYLSDTIQ